MLLGYWRQRLNPKKETLIVFNIHFTFKKKLEWFCIEKPLMGFWKVQHGENKTQKTRILVC